MNPSYESLPCILNDLPAEVFVRQTEVRDVLVATDQLFLQLPVLRGQPFGIGFGIVTPSFEVGEILGIIMCRPIMCY
jgi:hypothetical protein